MKIDRFGTALVALTLFAPSARAADPSGVLGAGEEQYALSPGDTWLLPAAVESHRIEARGERLTLLRIETRAG